MTLYQSQRLRASLGGERQAQLFERLQRVVNDGTQHLAGFGLGTQLAPCASHHDLWLVDGVGVQEHQCLTQVVLHSRGPEPSWRCTHDGNSLASKRLVAPSRCPVDGVLQTPCIE